MANPLDRSINSALKKHAKKGVDVVRLVRTGDSRTADTGMVRHEPVCICLSRGAYPRDMKCPRHAVRLRPWPVITDKED